MEAARASHRQPVDCSVIRALKHLRRPSRHSPEDCSARRPRSLRQLGPCLEARPRLLNPSRQEDSSAARRPRRNLHKPGVYSDRRQRRLRQRHRSLNKAADCLALRRQHRHSNNHNRREDSSDQHRLHNSNRSSNNNNSRRAGYLGVQLPSRKSLAGFSDLRCRLNRNKPVASLEDRRVRNLRKQGAFSAHRPSSSNNLSSRVPEAYLGAQQPVRVVVPWARTGHPYCKQPPLSSSAFRPNVFWW